MIGVRLFTVFRADRPVIIANYWGHGKSEIIISTLPEAVSNCTFEFIRLVFSFTTCCVVGVDIIAVKV